MPWKLIDLSKISDERWDCPRPFTCRPAWGCMSIGRWMLIWTKRSGTDTAKGSSNAAYISNSMLVLKGQLTFVQFSEHPEQPTENVIHFPFGADRLSDPIP